MLSLLGFLGHARIMQGVRNLCSGQTGVLEGPSDTHPLARPELALVAPVLLLDALQAHLLVLRLRHLAPVRPCLHMGKLAQSCILA